MLRMHFATVHKQEDYHATVKFCTATDNCCNAVTDVIAILSVFKTYTYIL